MVTKDGCEREAEVFPVYSRGSTSNAHMGLSSPGKKGDTQAQSLVGRSKSKQACFQTNKQSSEYVGRVHLTNSCGKKNDLGALAAAQW